MNEEPDLHDEAEAIRAETAADAPEVAEHDRIGELERELDEAKSKALYAYAVTGFARDMLTVRDHLDRALSHVPDEARADDKLKSFIDGIEATLREIDAVFARNGIERIAAKGLPLDPNKHQAMVEMPSDQEPGTIVEEMQSGYMLKDRLLRPALVGVAKAG